MTEQEQDECLFQYHQNIRSARRRLRKLLEDSGFRIRHISILGAYVHIDTFLKHKKHLDELMMQSGFVCVNAEYKSHLDGHYGFRMTFKADGNIGQPHIHPQGLHRINQAQIHNQKPSAGTEQD